MALRKSLAVLLSAVALTFGAPIVGIAQGRTATLRGQVVDAGGRGATGLQVELVSDRLVVATTVSGPDGHFSFSGLPADNYTVRTTVNGQPAGVRVNVAPGQTAQTALIVLPSLATASPAVIAVVGLNGVVTSLVIATSVVAGEVVLTAKKDDDQTVVQTSQQTAAQFIVAQIVQQLGATPTQAQTLITSVVGNNPIGATTPVPTITVTIPGLANPVTVSPSSGPR